MYIRLLGLVLIITTCFLAMAAFATQTMSIKLKSPSWMSSSEKIEQVAEPGSPVIDPTHANAPISATSTGAVSSVGEQVRFLEIPITWALAASAGLGLLLWFVPAAFADRPTNKRSKRRARRSSR